MNQLLMFWNIQKAAVKTFVRFAIEISMILESFMNVLESPEGCCEDICKFCFGFVFCFFLSSKTKTRRLHDLFQRGTVLSPRLRLPASTTPRAHTRAHTDQQASKPRKHSAQAGKHTESTQRAQETSSKPATQAQRPSRQAQREHAESTGDRPSRHSVEAIQPTARPATNRAPFLFFVFFCISAPAPQRDTNAKHAKDTPL